MGIWVSVGGGSFLQLLGPFSSRGMQFVNVGFFCIAIGAVLVLLGLLGFCGAHKESKCLLLTVGVSDLPCAIPVPAQMHIESAGWFCFTGVQKVALKH